MTTPTTLPDRLRALHASRVHHFTPISDTGQACEPALAIIATEARWQDLLDAAAELERGEQFSPGEIVTFDAGEVETNLGDLPLLTHDQVREAARAEMSDWRESGSVVEQEDRELVDMAIRHLCRRLVVVL